jgi:hypothetical protein
MNCDRVGEVAVRLEITFLHMNSMSVIVFPFPTNPCPCLSLHTSDNNSVIHPSGSVCVCVLCEEKLPEFFFLSSVPSWSSLWKQIPKYRRSCLHTAGWNFSERLSMKCLRFDHIDLQKTATNDVTTLNFSRYSFLFSSSDCKPWYGEYNFGLVHWRRQFRVSAGITALLDMPSFSSVFQGNCLR